MSQLIGVPIGIGGGIFLAEFGRGNKAGQRSPVHGGCAQWRAIDCDGGCGLCAGGDAAHAFSPRLRRCGAGHHDDSYRDAGPPKRCC